MSRWLPGRARRSRQPWIIVPALAITVVAVASSSLAAADLVERQWTSRVSVWSGNPNRGSASYAPRPCNRYGEAESGGFANLDFSPTTGMMFLFGFNPTKGSGVGSTWRTTVVNLGTASAGYGRLRVFVYCAVRRHPRLFIRTATTTIRGRHIGGVTARCPRGSEAVSGGFSMLPWRRQNPYYPSVKLFGFESRRVGHRGWHASAVNMRHRGWRHGEDRFMALVKCDPREPGLDARSEQVQVSRNETASADASCPEDHEAIAGGFEGGVQAPRGKGTFPAALRRSAEQTFTGKAFAVGKAARYTVYVYCKQPRT